MDNSVCIFCKSDSSTSKSVEHIIPESLGAIDIVLPVGIVCDKCNNYFASKVEGKVLDDLHFKSLRLFMEVPSKKGRIPLMPCLGPGPARWFIGKDEHDGSMYCFPDERDADLAKRAVEKRQSGRFIVPRPTEESNKYAMSRFLAKMAIEYLALKFINIENWQADVTFNQDLDNLRKYARYGDGGKIWEYSRREIFKPDSIHVNSTGDKYEILNEIDILYIKDACLYLVVCIFGVEYVISYTDPEYPHRYIEWLKDNGNVSPLHSGKNA